MATGYVRDRAPFHSLALVAWLLAATLPSLLTSNPTYLGVALVLVGWTHRRVAGRSRTAAAWGSFARFALFFVVFTLAFNVLVGGTGDTVLFELPAWRVTGEQGVTLFQIGGAVTLESVVFGLIRAAALLLVIFALATFNALADHSQLLRGLPRWLDQAATVLSIAVTFMPQVVAAQKDIREAQALRGHRLRKMRDFMPLVLVLLAEALERAIGMAESMEARGYSGPVLPRSRRHLPRQLIAAGLLLLVAGAVAGDLRVAGEGAVWPSAAMVLGAILTGVALAIVGRRGGRTRYRRELWRPRDSGLTATSVLAAAVLLGLYLYDRAPFFYPVFPRLQAPSVDAAILVPLVAILAPIAFLPRPPAEPAEATS